jgi:hypothetical protein
VTFLPAVGAGGLAGFKLLDKSAPQQRAAFEKTPEVKRNIAYFEANIAKAKTPEDLIKDRRLLTVALGAFGLGDEISKGAYVRKALESDTADGRSFVRRIADARYLEFAKAFGYGDLTKGSNVELESFKKDIIQRYKQVEFERAVGRADGDIRLALNFRREIGKIANGESADKIGVLQVLGQRPLRELLTTALGLPSGLARLDVDRQKEIVEQRMEQAFGSESVAVFKDAKKVEDAIRRFFAVKQTQSNAAALASGSGYSLLSTQGAGAGNLLLSNI